MEKAMYPLRVLETRQVTVQLDHLRTVCLILISLNLVQIPPPGVPRLVHLARSSGGSPVDNRPFTD